MTSSAARGLGATSVSIDPVLLYHQLHIINWFKILIKLHAESNSDLDVCPSVHLLIQL